MMTDPKRLLELHAGDSGSVLERELLESLKPPSHARGAVWGGVTRKLGIATGASAIAAASAAKAATTAAAGATGTSGMSTATTIGSMSWLAKTALALAIAAPTLGGAVYLGSQATNDAPAPSEPPTARVGAPPAERDPVPPLSSNEEESAPVDTAAPQRATPPRSATPPKSASRSKTPSRNLLSEENELLRRARSTLRTGDAAGALRTLAVLDRRFPRGTLGQEREVLRIEALEAQGQHAVAKRRAERFLESYPNSPYAPHVRSSVGSSTAP